MVVVVWVVVLVLAAFSFLTASLPSWRATALYRDTPFACEGTPDSPGLYVDGTGGAFSLDSYLPCTAQDLMPKDSDKYNFLVNSILPSAIDYLESTLSVLPVTSPMSWASEAWADSYCLNPPIKAFVCCNFTMPMSARTGISNADFVLYVTKRPTQGAVLAWVRVVDDAVSWRSDPALALAFVFACLSL